MPSRECRDPDSLDDVFDCLDRNFDAPSDVVSQDETVAAIGLDTNALKQLRRLPYLTTQLAAATERAHIPLLLPGQSIEEFWNNHRVFTRDLSAIDKDLQSLSAKLSTLMKSTTVDDLIAQLSKIAEGVGEFQKYSEESRNPELVSISQTMMAELTEVAYVSYVPRVRFSVLGQTRYWSKIAPGFEDRTKYPQHLGDFYVWADFLYGLRVLKRNGVLPATGRVLFVTDDSKADWKTGNFAHPSLSNEIAALTGLGFATIATADMQAMTEGIQAAIS